ncbi:hypothetical protein [Sediminitomix flava]|uniref:Uncharacterized protein n=1 Tax=Sediminitomix flava TaxID=379075 RepID=A0A315ZH09_SEDFL|nr:hypothetical protein [Sediminitomix flava]PWJ44866.1 hypothetical protein BC781_1011255 [Sediminitomix flava]
MLNWRALLWGCILFFIVQIIIIMRIAHISEHPDHQVKNTQSVLKKQFTELSLKKENIEPLNTHD